MLHREENPLNLPKLTTSIDTLNQVWTPNHYYVVTDELTVKAQIRSHFTILVMAIVHSFG
jgi:hypothetical protein